MARSTVAEIARLGRGQGETEAVLDELFPGTRADVERDVTVLVKTFPVPVGEATFEVTS